jgi:hypothetical protein
MDELDHRNLGNQLKLWHIQDDGMSQGRLADAFQERDPCGSQMVGAPGLGLAF